MPLSGSNTGALRPYTALQLIEEATSRAGIKPTSLTTEIVEKSLDQLNLVFTQMLNRGIQLWKRQKMILPCYLNQQQISLPAGVNVIGNLTRRSMQRQIGTPFTDGGGDAALAFDNDLATACTQTSVDVTNGLSIGCIFDQTTQITTAGVLFDAAAVITNLSFEYSLDGVTNWTALTSVQGTVARGQWVWVDLDAAPAALGWRVRCQSSMFFSATEIYFGNQPQEIPLDPWNLDEYTSMPNKTTPGRVVNYYQQRNLDNVVLYVWPVPNNQAVYDQLIVWAQEYLDEVSAPTQALDVPRRWYDAITAQLARRLCRSLPEADVGRYNMLRAEEQEALELAEGEERDPSNSNIDMGLGAYTA